MGRRALHEQIRALVARLEFCIRNIHTQPPALALGCLNPGGWFAFDEMAEFVRQGAISGEIKDGLMTPWRMCKVNDRYQVRHACLVLPMHAWYSPMHAGLFLAAV